MEQQVIIEAIVKGITEFKLIPFFGAGMSKACGAKDWNELVRVLIAELGTDTRHPLEVAQEYEDQYGREKLLEQIGAGCTLSKIDSGTLKNHLLIMGMNPPLIYTTNFDNALEEAAKLLNRQYAKIVSVKDILGCPHGKEQIIKFHGDLDQPESIVFTRSDYNRRLQTDIDPLDIRLRSDILGKGLLFLGYSFSDENIELIFQLHRQRYGQALMPRSYLVSFASDPEKERLLAEKNIITLVLSGPEELARLIESISQKVFDASFQQQLKHLFGQLTTVSVTRSDLEHLEHFVDDVQFSEKQKSDKIIGTLSMKKLAADAREGYVRWVKKIVSQDDSVVIKKALLSSYRHLYGLTFENVLGVSFELLELTCVEGFIRDMDKGNWFDDVVLIIEHKLGDLLTDTIEMRKMICNVILGFMEGSIAENKKLTMQQVDRFLDTLKVQRYQELDLQPVMSPESIKEILDHYLKQYPQLRSEFDRPFSVHRHTLTEIQQEMMRQLPGAI